MLALVPWGVETLSPSPLTVLAGRMLLAMTVFSFAFSWRHCSEHLLRGNDLSYGVYLYHGLAINVLAQLNWKGSQTNLLLVSAITVICAALSWLLVERPAVTLKSRGSKKSSPESAAPDSLPGEPLPRQPLRRAA